jgi:hypothetical protein
MTAVLQLRRWFDRRANPIVVRELRQAVRSRFVTGMLLIFLVALLGTTGIYTLVVSQMRFEESLAAGRGITMRILGILFVVCMLFVPIYTGLRLVFERRGVQADLMFITTLSPGAVVRGKMLSAAMLTLLIFSACLPFLTYTYLLRGVDLPGLLFSIVVGFLCIMLVTQVVLLFSALPMSIVFRILLTLGALPGLIYSAVWLIFMATEMQYMGASYDSDFWIGAMILIASALAVMGLFYVLTVAVLSPPSANRTLPVRLYITGLWLAGLIVISIVCMYYGDWDGIYAWFIPVLVILLTSFIIGSCERQSWGPRVRRHIPRNPLGRLVAFIFFSGAPGGMLWSTLMLELSFIIVFLIVSANESMIFFDTEDLSVFMIFALYTLAYALSGVLLWLLFFKKLFSHRHIWAITLGVAMVCILLAGLVYSFDHGALPSRYRRSFNPILLLSPFTVIASWRMVHALVACSAVWCGITGVIVLGWTFRLYQQFTPLAKDAGVATVPPIPDDARVIPPLPDEVIDGRTDS